MSRGENRDRNAARRPQGLKIISEEDRSMAEGHAPKLVGQLKTKNPANLTELVEHFEAQANILQEGGWAEDAASLRKWAAELKEKPARDHLR
jgi:hypothetical protein